MPDTVNVLSPIHYSQGLDRPHIIHNPKTGKYVCWIKNLSDETQFFTILQSDHFMGPYTIVNPGFRPNGYEAGDFDLYVDEQTGKGYVWFERPHWEMICCELNDDFTGVTDKLSHHYTGKTTRPHVKPPLILYIAANIIYFLPVHQATIPMRVS